MGKRAADRTDETGPVVDKEQRPECGDVVPGLVGWAVGFVHDEVVGVLLASDGVCDGYDDVGESPT